MTIMLIKEVRIVFGIDLFSDITINKKNKLDYLGVGIGSLVVLYNIS